MNAWKGNEFGGKSACNILQSEKSVLGNYTWYELMHANYRIQESVYVREVFGEMFNKMFQVVISMWWDLGITLH